LKSSYRAGTKLNGILYLHSITAPKIAGSAFDNLCMFRKLYGEDALQHVVLATTFWGSTDLATEERRESALIQNDTLWGRMMKARSKVVRLESNRESALNALRDVSNASKVILQAQYEMIEEGKASNDTEAARFISSCGRHTTSNEYRERLKKKQDENKERMEELKKIREKMQAQDEKLAKLKAEARKVKIEITSSPPQSFESFSCRCKLVGRARCAKCRGSVGGTFYRKSLKVQMQIRSDTVLGCCLYTGKTYLQCKKCGNHRPNWNHPDMEKMKTYCIVM
jgi:hypothetical protein